MVGFSDQELRDSARLALQSAFAAAATFLIMQWMAMPEKFVGVLSGVLVVQPSAGSTLGAAGHRIVATIIGCIIGVLCLVVLPNGYGTAAALALAMLIMNAIAGLQPAWRYGVVAAVALALGSESDLLFTAMDRSIAIGLGSAVGAISSLFLWPDRAEDRARRHLRTALNAVAALLNSVVDTGGDADEQDANKVASEFHSSIADARDATGSVKFAATQELEHKIRYVDRLYNSVLIIKRVSEDSDDLTEGDKKMNEIVDALRAACIEIVQQIADDDRTADRSQLQDSFAKLERAQQLAKDNGDSGAIGLRHSALIFGFKEVLEQLEALVSGDS